MDKYSYEELERKVLKEVYVDKNVSSLIIALYDGSVTLYPLDFEGKGFSIVNDIENAFLLFFNEVTNNPNFDLTNFRMNLKRNLVIGVDMADVKPDAGTTLFDESKNLFGIFCDHNLVDRGVIYHELFHYAFRPNGGTTFRRGLNEGYTEALAHRYFSKEKQAYPDNVHYVLELEKIVGMDVMENAYSKGDIKIIKNALGEENINVFERFNDKMDLLLGSYYRVNSGKALPDEEDRILKAREVLDECLNIMGSVKENNKLK